MAEYISFEEVMDRMLSRVDDSFDKRESSPIYAALAPAAFEIMELYTLLSDMMDESFADTASREYLIPIASTRGIYPDEATRTMVKAIFTPPELDIAVGERFTSPESSYILISKVSDGIYELECEEAGEVGNLYTGEIIPAEYIDGLETASITEILIYGEPEEETESIRQRYFDTFVANEFGGNRMEYKNKTLSISGVGAVKVLPTWDGAGTVKLIILDSVYKQASEQLVNTVQILFDPKKDGCGDGLAPIGHIVTVGTVENVVVTICCRITYDSGYDYNTCKLQILSVLEVYLARIREEWSDQNQSVVRISSINAAIMSVQGVLDVSGTVLNDVAENLGIGEYQIPILGEVSEIG